MNRKNIETYQMLTQVKDFTTQNVGLFPENSAAAEIREALESGVKTLADEACTIVSSETAMRVGRTARKKARERLKTVLVRASQIAEGLNADIVQLPAKQNERALIDSGRALAVSIEPLKEEFDRHGLPVEAIRAAVEALEHAILTCTTAKATRSAAAEKWAATLEATLLAVKRYDPLVAITLEGNPGALASYAVARKVPHNGGGRRPAAETPPATESDPAPIANAAAA